MLSSRFWGLKVALTFAASLVMLRLLLPVQAANASTKTFDKLISRLVQDGFSPNYVAAIYNPQPVPLYETVAQTLRIRESKLNYGQFLQPAAIEHARRFLQEHGDALHKTEKTYDVDKYVIVAILSVETRLGQYTGRTPTLDILSTFALMDRKHFRDIIWTRLSSKDRIHWERSAFDRKLMQRAQWAYGELSALLRWAGGNAGKVKCFKGSLMGAVGMPQFLPSNLLRYGVDADSDGEVDLFQPGDAIPSVANYLIAHGWRETRSQSEKEKVIYRYNRSRPYVNAVLSIADVLRGMEESLVSRE